MPLVDELLEADGIINRVNKSITENYLTAVERKRLFSLISSLKFDLDWMEDNLEKSVTKEVYVKDAMEDYLVEYGAK